MSGTIVVDPTAASFSIAEHKIELEPAEMKPAQSRAEWLNDIRREYALPSAPEPEVICSPDVATLELSKIDFREIVVATASYGVSVACQVIALSASLLPFGLGRPIAAPMVRHIFPVSSSRE